MVQYRWKSGNDLERLAQAKELRSICQHFEALFIINDRIDIALAVEADGVHLGQEDLPTKLARSLIGDEKLLGRSTHCLSQLQQAEKEGCDYLGIGPINNTQTKPQIKPVGLKYVKEASNATQLPCFAIGGINNSNVKDVRTAGAERIAVVSAIMNANNPAEATIELLKAMS